MDAIRGPSPTDRVIVVTGGGTSGHVHPALAVLESLEEYGWERDRLHYVGCRRGVETTLLPESGFDHTLLAVRGFERSISLRALVHNVMALVLLLVARRRATSLLRRLGASVVVSVGGYASAPAAMAASRLRLGLVVCSYDRVPGRATRLQARRAVVCCVSDVPSPLPRARLTGAPVRRSIRELDRDAHRAGARARLGMPLDRPLVAVVGGSLGAPRLNAAADAIAARVGPSVSLLVLEGERHRKVESVERDGTGATTLKRIASHRPVADVYAAADLLVCRAGASTMAEVAVTGTPAVVVPWPGAADDHQRANAAVLAECGAAVVVEEGPGFEAEIAEVVADLVGDAAHLAALSAAARSTGTRHRGAAVAEVVAEVAMTRRPGDDRQG